MATDDVRCVLVIVHGIGSQGPAWSRDFETALATRLAELAPDRQRQVTVKPVWWGDLTRPPAGEASPALAAPAGPGSLTFDLAYQQYLQYLLLNQAIIRGTRERLGLPGPGLAGTVVARLRDVTVAAGAFATDVATYVSNNAVRLAIQHRVMDALFAAQDRHPRAALILGSHSQGTVIGYDVLRLVGGRLPRLRTWVTMGSPLGWYLSLLRWGDAPLGMPDTLTWLNLYDPRDIIGTTLQGVIRWPAPAPADVDVDNVGQRLAAHDHWRNPAVVAQYARLIADALSSPRSG